MKVVLFKIAQKIPEYLGYICEKICYLEDKKSPNLVTLDFRNPQGSLADGDA